MEWVKVTERLPEDSDAVLLYVTDQFGHKSILYDCHLTEDNHWVTWKPSEFDEECDYRRINKYETPTHWLRLVPPNE